MFPRGSQGSHVYKYFQTFRYIQNFAVQIEIIIIFPIIQAKNVFSELDSTKKIFLRLK